MCNYGTDKLNAQQSKAFSDPWLLDFDKEQAAFLGQFTVFKIKIPVLMNTVIVAWMGDFCHSLMRALHCRYTVKHASLIQLWNHQCVLKKLCKALKAAWFVLGLVTCQLMQEGIEFLNQWVGHHILLHSEFSQFCSTLTFQRDQAPALCALPQGARIPHKLTLIQSPGSGCLTASQRVSEDILFVCVFDSRRYPAPLVWSQGQSSLRNVWPGVERCYGLR